jgi:hypothetical protein
MSVVTSYKQKKWAELSSDGCLFTNQIKDVMRPSQVMSSLLVRDSQ